MNGCFSKESRQMAKNHMRMLSTPLVIRQTQSITTVKFPFTHSRIVLTCCFPFLSWMKILLTLEYTVSQRSLKQRAQPGGQWPSVARRCVFFGPKCVFLNTNTTDRHRLSSPQPLTPRILKYLAQSVFMLCPLSL